MQIACPHCGKKIELLEPSDIRSEFGLSPNQMQHARTRGSFPEPYLRLNNRYLYLRDAIEEYVRVRSRAKADTVVSELLATLEALPVDEAAEVRSLLQERITPAEDGRSSRGSARSRR